MQHLLPITVRRLRIAAARLRETRRSTGTDRAIWIAAKNYRRDALAQPEDAPESITLPHTLVERINELTADIAPEEPKENGIDTDTHLD